MKYYRFSLDDNIWVFRDLARGRYHSIFEHPYLSFLREIHEEFHSKIQLNVYYETEGFCLSQMPDSYKGEWEENADWLRLSFHARADDPPSPYEKSGYAELFADCSAVQKEICRFAGPAVLSPYTTIHYCKVTPDGCRGLKDCGVKGLVGLFRPQDGEQVDYSLSKETEAYLQTNHFCYDEEYGMFFVRNDLIINVHPLSELEDVLKGKENEAFLEVMIHEQYFYPDYPYYQPDFREKVCFVIQWLTEKGYAPAFLEEMLK